MASVTVNAKLDTYVDSRNRSSNYQTETLMYAREGRYVSLLQFDIPALDDVNITGAKLYMYVKTRGYQSITNVFWCDVNEIISGVTYASYANTIEVNEVLQAEGEYVWEYEATGEFNEWISIDITNLVIGHAGKSNYTLSIKSESTGSNIVGQVPIATMEAGYTPYIQLTYEYATPFKPKIVYPDGDSLSNSGTLTFSWKYQSSGKTPQKKFDLQWKMQSATNWNSISQTTSNTYYAMDASALTNGIVEWRVRTYNQYNMASEWAESQFVVVGKPGNPVISGVKNDAITEVTWSANRSEEAAARIRIKRNGAVVYDSGVIPAGISDSYKVNAIFENGNYVALLSISNMYNMWSDEVAYSFTIGQTKPAIPTLAVSGMGDYVHLEYTAVQNAEYFIYRSDGGDFIPIGRTTKNHYDDYAVMSGKIYQYFVRVYTGSYSDSAIRDVYIKYDGYYVSGVDDMGKRVKLFYHDSEHYVPFERRKSNNSVLVKYSGRERPVRESGIHKSSTVTIEAFVTRKDDELFWQIYGQNSILCIRGKELLLYGDVSSPSEVMTFFNRGYLLGLTFEEVDYQEQVRFDE